MAGNKSALGIYCDDPEYSGACYCGRCHPFADGGGVVNIYRRSVIVALTEAQDSRCPYCPQPLARVIDVHKRSPMRPSLDHVMPQAAGGLDCKGNWLVAHTRCNERKGQVYPSPEVLAFLERVNARLGWHTPDLRRFYAVEPVMAEAAA